MQRFCKKISLGGRILWGAALLLALGLAVPTASAQPTKSAGTFQFTSASYFGTPSETLPPRLDVRLQRSSLLGVRMTVTRTGGSTGRVLVDYSGSANGTLIFDDHEQSKSILVTGVGTVALNNPRLADGESLDISPPVLGGTSSAGVTIYNVNPSSPTNIVMSFERANYRVREDEVDEGQTFDVDIYVNRVGAPDQSTEIYYKILTLPLILESSDNRRNNTFLLEAGSDYATPLPLDVTPYGRSADFYGNSGKLTWGANDLDPKPITLTITNDSIVEFNEDIYIQLWFDPKTTGEIRELGEASQTHLTILHDDLPAGAIDPSHNPDYNLNTVPPNNPNPGANGVVYATVVQPNGATLIGGSFTAVNTVSRNRIARLNANGSNDASFDPGTGANSFITSLALESSGKIFVGGGFTSFNGNQLNRIARLGANGAVDGTFNPGTGANGAVWCLAVQSDGKVLIGGEFTTVNGVARNHIARLNANGSLDTTFDPGVGPDSTVNAIVVTGSGAIVIGGEFTTISGTTRAGVARLTSTGALDATFNPGAGADGPVYALALQGANQVLVGGAFVSMDLRARHGLARLNSDGSLDEGFDIGTGANDTVYSIALQGNGRILVGGIFTSFNQTRRVGLVRLFSYGAVDTSFLDTAYNDFAGIINLYHSDPANFVFSIALDANNDVMIGGGFKYIGGGRWDTRIQPEGHDFGTYTRAAYRVRNNIARLLGGETTGPGAIEFVYSSYQVDENTAQLYVTMMRTNGDLGPVTANFQVVQLPPGPGAAMDGVDYANNGNSPSFGTSYGLNLTRMMSDGLSGPNFGTRTVIPDFFVNSTADDIYVNIFDNTLQDGDRTALLQLSAPSDSDIFFLGGENIPIAAALGRSSATMLIVDNDTLPGTFSFSSSAYTVNEDGTNAIITVTRTNGSTGSATVRFQTSNGTALAGLDYISTNATLSFLDGQTSKSFGIRIVDDSSIEPDESVNLVLFNPTGGATLGLTNAVLTIIDNDFPGGKVGFTSTTYSTNESSVNAVISVKRAGSSAGTMTIYASATNGTATAGTDFTGVTNLLTWADGDTANKTFIVPLLDDTVIESNETVTLRLFNPTLNGVTNQAALGSLSNATLTILNDDFLGTVAFSTAVYSANENGGPASITVVRSGGSSASISVNFAAVTGTAISGVDFVATNGTLLFGPGEASKTFTVPIIDNSLPDAARFITLSLSGASPIAGLGNPSAAIINLVDDESITEPPGGVDTDFSFLGANDNISSLALQTDGKIVASGEFTAVAGLLRNRIARFNANGSLDLTFSTTATNAGANAKVNALVCQTDGRILIGGEFSSVTGASRSGFARLNFNGSLDAGFDPGSGTDGSVFALAESFANGSRIIFLGGGFTSYNGNQRSGLARVDNTGNLDASFNPQISAGGIVYAIVPYPTNSPQVGKVLIAGDFSSVNGAPRAGVARLNSDGSLDLSFNPGNGANAAVRALALQSDGRILFGGSFTNYNGTAINRIARLNPNGTLDNTFTPGVGADDVVNAITIQADTRIVLGGQFTHCNGVTRHRVTRLNNNGTADATINFGAGANNFVAATLVQSDGKIIIGGGFSEYDGVPRQRIARIYGRSLAGSGTLEFTSSSYQVSESATNATITVRRYGGTAGLTPGASVSVDAVTSNGTATDGIHYIGGTSTLFFAEGEVFQSFTIPVIDNFEINSSRSVNLTLGNILPPGSASIGNQPTATLTILDDDTAISFSSATYTRNEHSPDGQATITVVRTGSTAAPATVNFTTTTNGMATAGLDFTPVTNLVSFAIGETMRTVTIPIINDLLIEGNETVTMELTNAIGGLLIVPTTATLTIVDDDIGPGRIAFASLSYAAAENGGNAVITLVRTNGSSGVVGVTLKTSDFTAVAGLDYTAINIPVTFGDGETTKNVLLQVMDDTFVEGNEIFHVTLTNATGGTTIGEPATAPVTIIDNDMGLSFSSPFYSVDESAGSVTLTVVRLGGSNGVATVRYDTTNLTATAGLDFTGVSNGLLTFAHGEILKTFTIPILDDALVEGDEAIRVNLSNPSGGLQLLLSSTVVSILDNDTGFSLATNNYVVNEGDTNVMITVFRTNANTGPVSVSLTTSGGTAMAGADYTAAGGALNFTNGEATKTVIIPIINDTAVEGDETFQVTLSGASPGTQIIGITEATVTIVDNDAGLQFSSANYTVSEIGVAATITVLRTGITNSTVTANYSTSDGTATVGLDYSASSGTLVFSNGVLSRTFSLQIIDDTIEEGAETVLLSLSSPTGQVSLLNPNAATLTIVDNEGGSILPAGTLLTAENGAPNGAIDPGETVTLLFAMRNASGVNTTNLTATLLVTNGVTAPSGPQNYGPLENNGAAVSRPFSFTANGTNGGLISATFQVQDGPSSYGRVTFAFLLGNRTTVFSNTAPITIVDFAVADPYPASITVTGLVGTVSKVVVMLTNLYHPSPDDIDIVLAGPTGINTMLMSDCGGGNFITNVTLTFDDAAAGSLPDTTIISSGTYKPTNFLLADFLPSPAPSAPWGSTLAAYTGTNPNGLWSLFIKDDLAIFSGSIQRGWQLAISTLGTIPAATDLALKMTAVPATVVAGSNLTYSVNVTNHGPWAATGVKLTNAIPVGSVFASATTSVGSVSTNSGQVVWTIGALAKDAGATASIVVVPNATGSAVAIATSLGSESDLNPGNNVATNINTVVVPSADLAIGMVDSPDPLYIVNGGNLTYTISVINLGPATASAVSITNTLPLGVTFQSATPLNSYTLNGGVVTFTNLGSLGFGALPLVATITVRAVTPATLTNTATCSSAVVDPLKGNNVTSVKSIVDFPLVSARRVGNNLLISWPADATGYALESATNLTTPIFWSLGGAPVNVGGINYVTNTIGTGNRFFRLRAVAP